MKLQEFFIKNLKIFFLWKKVVEVLGYCVYVIAKKYCCTSQIIHYMFWKILIFFYEFLNFS